MKKLMAVLKGGRTGSETSLVERPTQALTFADLDASVESVKRSRREEVLDLAQSFASGGPIDAARLVDLGERIEVFHELVATSRAIIRLRPRTKNLAGLLEERDRSVRADQEADVAIRDAERTAANRKLFGLAREQFVLELRKQRKETGANHRAAAEAYGRAATAQRELVPLEAALVHYVSTGRLEIPHEAAAAPTNIEMSQPTYGHRVPAPLVPTSTPIGRNVPGFVDEDWI